MRVSVLETTKAAGPLAQQAQLVTAMQKLKEKEIGCRWDADGPGMVEFLTKKMIDMFNGNSRILKWRNVSTILFGGIFPYIERWPLIDMLFKIDGHDN